VPDEPISFADMPDDPSPDLKLDFNVSDIVGYEIGWRSWSIVDLERHDDPRLCSYGDEFVWEPREPSQAVCKFGRCGPDEMPGKNCSCGLYSAKTLEHLLTMPYHQYNGEYGHYRILGKVAVWGDHTRTGELGWRSEFCYPLQLWVPHELWWFVEPIERIYGVPTTMMDFLKPADEVVREAILGWRR
jgi:hypothetical protein